MQTRLILSFFTFFLVKYAGGLMMAELAKTYCSFQEIYSC